MAKFMYIFRGGYAKPGELSPAQLQAHLAKWYRAAVADVERRAGNAVEARAMYERAVALAKSRAERVAYGRRIRNLGN